MTKFKGLQSLALALFFAAGPVWAARPDFFDAEFPIQVAGTEIVVGTYNPRVSDMATVVYLHGYADRMNNHEMLLSQLHDGGMRVISFDFPSHGKSGGSIWTWSLRGLAEVVRHILDHDTFTSGRLAVDRSLPLVLVGWSTGATIAIRGGQAWSDVMIPKDMRLAGLVAFAPALPARPLVGDGFSRWGAVVKAQDLTRNPHLIKYPPKPATTVLGSGPFAVSLEATSMMARVSVAPDIPTLVFMADNDKDFFAYANSSANWVRRNRSKPVYGFQCPGAHHGLEFEPDGVAEQTRELTIEFIQRLARYGAADVQAAFGRREVRVCPRVH